jgi:predicted nucleic acid-binding protein
MTLLLDSSLWIDCTTPVAEPVRFQVLRSARPQEALQLEAQYAVLPSLQSPADQWERAITLGQACRQVGRTALSLDLLVAAMALHHNAVLVSFDTDFEAIIRRRKLPWRYRWSDAMGDDVLARLLARNPARPQCRALCREGGHGVAQQEAQQASKASTGGIGSKRRGRSPKARQLGETEPPQTEMIGLAL